VWFGGACGGWEVDAALRWHLLGAQRELRGSLNLVLGLVSGSASDRSVRQEREREREGDAE